MSKRVFALFMLLIMLMSSFTVLDQINPAVSHTAANHHVTQPFGSTTGGSSYADVNQKIDYQLTVTGTSGGSYGTYESTAKLTISNGYSNSQIFDKYNVGSGKTYTHTFSWNYQWTSTSSNGASYSWSISLTTNYGTTDSGGSGDSGTSYIYKDPTVSISQSKSVVDIGQSNSYSSSVSSGRGGYTYQWHESGPSPNTSPGTGSGYSTSYSTSGTASVSLTVTDANGYSVTSSALSTTVDSALGASISSSNNPSDVGQSVVFTAAASGGSGTYTKYNFYLNGNSVQSGSGNQFTQDFTSSGSDTVYVIATDSNGYSQKSNTITQTVNSDPTASISSSQNPTDTGNTISFNASVSDGTPKYSFSWSVDGNTYKTKDINVSFSSTGTYAVDLTVTDAAGYSVTKSYSETVNSDPTVSTSSNVSSADTGYPIEFSSSPSGGVGPYSYSWVINGNQVSTSQDFSHVFNSAGSYTATVTVTDSVGKTYSASVTVDVNSNPSVSVTSSQNPTDVGNSVRFSSTLSGGTGTDTYVWTINGVQESSASQFSHSFSSTGTYFVNLTVTDGDGHVGFASFKETVNSDPSISINVVHNPTDVGVWANFTAIAQGGTGGYSYSWSLNSQTFTTGYVNYTFTSPGTYPVSVKATDANGNTATATVNEIVNPRPTATISASYKTVDQGINDTFFAQVTGGTSPFYFTWTLSGNIVSHSQQFHLNFSALGTYRVNLSLSDSLGSTANTSIQVKVIQKPSALVEGSNITDLNTETYWEGYGSFGTAPYNYYWYINGVNESSGLYLSYRFPKTGMYNITLKVIDSQGSNALAYMNVKVVSLPSISLNFSRTVVDTGTPVYLNSSVSGGDPFYNYSWSVSGIGYIGYQENTVYSFSHPGNYTVTLKMFDGSGNSASRSLKVVVNSLPSVKISPDYSNIDPNVTDAFNSLVTGGTPGYSYRWYVGPSLVGTAETLNYSFSTPGVYPLTLEVFDSLGQTAQYITDITVSSYPHATIIYGASNFDANVSETFRATASGGIGPFSYEWIIGGQEYSNSTVVHSFNEPGNYTVQVIVSDAFGKDSTSTLTVTVHKDPKVRVASNGSAEVSQSVGLQANITGGLPTYEVQWIFSDGQQETGASINHVFQTSGPEAYQVVVKDSGGFYGTYNFSINVSLHVTISSSTPSGLAPLQENFYSDVLGGSGYAYQWTFGNGNTSVAPDPSQEFGPGNYTVTLQVTSSNGATGSASLKIQSLPSPVSIAYSPGKNITVLTPVHFTANPSWDAHGPYNVSWSFPNGQTFTGLNVTYKFPVYKEFDPVVVNFKYGSNQVSETLDVRMVPATPSISVALPEFMAKNTFIVLNSTASSPDGQIVNYSWDINGTVYYGQDIPYTFSNTGNISVTATATDSLGASVSKTLKVEVLPVGSSNSISINVKQSVSKGYVTFEVNVKSVHGIAVIEALQGTTLLVPSFTNSTNGHNYNLTLNERDYSPGNYPVKFIVFNNNSQSNEVTATFTVSNQYGKTPYGFIQALGPTHFVLMIVGVAAVIGLLITYHERSERVIEIPGTDEEMIGRNGHKLFLRKIRRNEK